jgi:hypothetical protein
MQANTPQIPVDPNLAAEQQQAQNTLVSGLQTQSETDTASIMSRYGARQALATTGAMAPAAAPAPVSKGAF